MYFPSEQQAMTFIGYIVDAVSYGESDPLPDYAVPHVTVPCLLPW